MPHAVYLCMLGGGASEAGQGCVKIRISSSPRCSISSLVFRLLVASIAAETKAINACYATVSIAGLRYKPCISQKVRTPLVSLLIAELVPKGNRKSSIILSAPSISTKILSGQRRVPLKIIPPTISAILPSVFLANSEVLIYDHFRTVYYCFFKVGNWALDIFTAHIS